MPPADPAMAELCSEVDRSSVTAGGVTTANFPHVARNLRRSASEPSSGELLNWAMRPPFKVRPTALQIRLCHLRFQIKLNIRFNRLQTNHLSVGTMRDSCRKSEVLGARNGLGPL